VSAALDETIVGLYRATVVLHGITAVKYYIIAALSWITVLLYENNQIKKKTGQE